MIRLNSNPQALQSLPLDPKTNTVRDRKQFDLTYVAPAFYTVKLRHQKKADTIARKKLIESRRTGHYVPPPKQTRNRHRRPQTAQPKRRNQRTSGLGSMTVRNSRQFTQGALTSPSRDKASIRPSTAMHGSHIDSSSTLHSNLDPETAGVYRWREEDESWLMEDEFTTKKTHKRNNDGMNEMDGWNEGSYSEDGMMDEEEDEEEEDSDDTDVVRWTVLNETTNNLRQRICQLKEQRDKLEARMKSKSRKNSRRASQLSSRRNSIVSTMTGNQRKPTGVRVRQLPDYMAEQLEFIGKQYRSDSEDDDHRDGQRSSEDDVDSIMSFSEDDGLDDDINSDEIVKQGLKTLKKKHTMNLSRIEANYMSNEQRKSRLRKQRRKKNRMQSRMLIDKDDDDSDSDSDNDRDSDEPRVFSSNEGMSNSKKMKKKTKPLTVPTEFSFIHKYKNRPKSISGKNLQEWVNERERKQRELENWTFKANPVPLSSIITSTNTNIDMSDQKKKKNKKHNNSDDDDQIESIQNNNNNKWKSKDLPWFVKTPLYESMITKDKEQRQLRIKKRAKEQLAKSKLPNRMEQSKKNQQLIMEKKERIRKEHEKELTYMPEINHKVPDFNLLHYRFQESLKQKKTEFKPTKPQSFSFDRSNQSSLWNDDGDSDDDSENNERMMDDEELAKKQKRLARLQRMLQTKENKNKNKNDTNLKCISVPKTTNEPPKIIPKTTVKFEQANQLRKQKECKLQLEQYRLEKKRMDKEREIKEKWKGKIECKIVNNNMETKMEMEQQKLIKQNENKEKQKQLQLSWKKTKEDIAQRVSKRPLLIETCCVYSQIINNNQPRESTTVSLPKDGIINEKKKQSLKLVQKCLEMADVSDIKAFFSDDELELLES